MNFVAHYYIDNHLDNGLFVAGVSTPDLVPVFNGKYRLKRRQVLAAMEGEEDEAFLHFAQGVLRHFEADDYFHSAPFFREENALISEMIRNYFPNNEVKRTFFVSHILFELILDRVLVLDNVSTLDSYYQYWYNQDLAQLSHMTAKVVGVGMDAFQGYEEYIKRFVRKKYLYGFSEWKDVLYVFKKIMERVRIQEANYIYSQTFRDMLEEYQAILTPKVPSYIAEMRAKLSQNPLG